MNVKAGDLAITTYSRIEGNTGMLVEVIRFIGKRDKYDERSDIWIVKVLGSPKLSNQRRYVTEGYFPDQYLRPVSGLPIEEDTNIEERVPA